jgi:uncharacterized protein
VDRLFLDANVLFSAAYRADAAVARLWALEGVELATSAYAAEEAERNLRGRERKDRLGRLLDAMRVVSAGMLPEAVRAGIGLPEKDWPIVAGAVAAEATHFITGDVQHFGPYFGKRIAGILVLTPADYLRR